MLSYSAFSQNCNIGNQSQAGFSASTSISENYLLGVKFTLAAEGTLNSLNLIGQNTGSQVQMAVYIDSMGIPGRLIARTATGKVGFGVVSLPVASTIVSPGDYWIMAVYSTFGAHTYYRTDKTQNVVYYKALPFGNPIPQKAHDFIKYTGQDFTYFMGIDCGTSTHSEDIKYTAGVDLFPNPAANTVTVKIAENLLGSDYTITSIVGENVAAGKLNEESNTINISELKSGIYLLKVGKEVIKLVKS